MENQIAERKKIIMMNNIPEVKLGVVAVSRDCFVITLSERRRKELCEAYRAAGGDV